MFSSLAQRYFFFFFSLSVRHENIAPFVDRFSRLDSTVSKLIVCCFFSHDIISRAFFDSHRSTWNNNSRPSVREKKQKNLKSIILTATRCCRSVASRGASSRDISRRPPSPVKGNRKDCSCRQKKNSEKHLSRPRVHAQDNRGSKGQCTECLAFLIHPVWSLYRDRYVDSAAAAARGPFPARFSERRRFDDVRETSATSADDGRGRKDHRE